MRALTPENVQSFIESMTQKTKPGGSLSDRDVKKYLETHIADDGLFTSILTYRIAGQDDQTQEVSVNKKQFIHNIMQGRQSMREYESEVSIGHIAIDAYEPVAIFSTQTIESGLMPVGGGKYTPFTGNSSCQQTLALDGMTPQITTAACESVIEITE